MEIKITPELIAAFRSHLALVGVVTLVSDGELAPSVRAWAQQIQRQIQPITAEDIMRQVVEFNEQVSNLIV
jgi:hypothetical protein